MRLAFQAMLARALDEQRLRDLDAAIEADLAEEEAAADEEAGHRGTDDEHVMANRYVYSGAGGAATGADWANAHLTMAAAITASTAGDTFYVAHDHSETTAAAVQLAFKGTAAAPDRVLCVNRVGSVPPVSADLVTVPSGIIATSGASNLGVQGHVYIYGLIFTASSGAVAAALVFSNQSASQACVVLHTCKLNLTATTATNVIIGGFCW